MSKESFCFKFENIGRKRERKGMITIIKDNKSINIARYPIN